MKKKDSSTRAMELFRNWQRDFPQKREVFVREGILINDYCRDCRFCCGPQPSSDKPFPMKLLDSQLSEENSRRFYLLDSHTACLDSRGCLSLGKNGCALDRRDRPVACNLFPFVVVNRRLYLYRRCPVSFLLPPSVKKRLARSLATSIRSMAPEDVCRISLRMDKRSLKKAYEHYSLPLEQGAPARKHR